MTCVYNKFVILANENWYCFNVFSKSEAFHGTIFQEKSFNITFCKPCKLFVNLWTFSFFSVPKVYNGFQGSGPLLVITQNNYQHKTSLGNEWWGEVISIKHCEKRLPLKWRCIRERSNFPRIWFRELKFRILGLEIKHLKAHNFV